MQQEINLNIETNDVNLTVDTTQFNINVSTGSGGGSGQDGRGITDAEIIDNDLILTYTDGIEQNVGRVVGENGLNGRGIDNVNIDNDDLIITYSDSTTENVGKVVGDDGQDGQDGRGIITINQLNNNTIAEVVYTDSTTQNLTLPVAPSDLRFLINRQCLFDDFDTTDAIWGSRQNAQGGASTVVQVALTPTFSGSLRLAGNANNSWAFLRSGNLTPFSLTNFNLEVLAVGRFSFNILYPTTFYFGYKSTTSFENLNDTNLIIAGTELNTTTNRYEFFLRTRASNITSTSYVTSILPQDSVIYKLRIQRIQGENIIRLFINDIQVTTLTTNIPGSDIKTALGVSSFRSTGTGTGGWSNEYYVDYIYHEQTITR